MSAEKRAQIRKKASEFICQNEYHQYEYEDEIAAGVKSLNDRQACKFKDYSLKRSSDR